MCPALREDGRTLMGSADGPAQPLPARSQVQRLDGRVLGIGESEHEDDEPFAGRAGPCQPHRPPSLPGRKAEIESRARAREHMVDEHVELCGAQSPCEYEAALACPALLTQVATGVFENACSMHECRWSISKLSGAYAVLGIRCGVRTKRSAVNACNALRSARECLQAATYHDAHNKFASRMWSSGTLTCLKSGALHPSHRLA